MLSFLVRLGGAYFVGIHITLCPTTCLEHDKREVIDKLERDDLYISRIIPEKQSISVVKNSKDEPNKKSGTHIIGSLANSFPDLRVEAVRHVHMCRRLLEDAKGFDERRRKALRRTANVKVLQRAVVSQSTISGIHNITVNTGAG